MAVTSTDPIADMLSRIRNAIAVNKSDISLPHSKVKEAIAKLLQTNKFIESVSVSDNEGIGKTLHLTLTAAGTNSRITEIVRLSTPGRRLFTGFDEIPTVKRGRGIVIVSTSKGLMTGDEAKKARTGGELICRIY